MCASSTNIVTFNPGPSQISTETLQAIKDISTSGFLSQSHRSQTFMDVSRRAIEGLREKMKLPANYHIFYQPSATVAMDTLLRNVVSQKSFHFVHGPFSSLFHQIAFGIGLEASLFESHLGQAVPWDKATIASDTELIAVTHNETSTGLMWPNEEIHKLRNQYPQQLLAVDVTSSFGAMSMRWEDADLWFGSVQKCLGLPSGLGFLIVSPRAFEKAQAKRGMAPWQSFKFLAEKMKIYQTPETPNMLNIALLAHQMNAWNLPHIEAVLYKKADMLYNPALEMHWKPFVTSHEWRSLTVTNFIVDKPMLWHERAKQAHMILGEGYGTLKDTCIRIANFPAISMKHLQKLLEVLSR